MDNLEDMKIIIDEIRQTLSTIIDEKQNLLDAEVIAISQKLDDTLNKYNNLREKK
jgi:Spo0E like sporulation regulatory protein.